MAKTNISKVSVALSPAEIKIVNRASKTRGIYNFSAALRQIVNEWDKANNPTSVQLQPAVVNEEETCVN